MSATICPNCDQLNATIAEQREKMLLIEKRLKDLIKAYKTVCIERDNLLVTINTSVLSVNNSDEQQQRVLLLESSVAEMSTICGKYESERVRDKQLIESLSQKCDELTVEIEYTRQLNSEKNESDDRWTYKRLRHRTVQTEHIECEIDNNHHIQHNSLRVDSQTQTDLLEDFESSNKSKKTELAIVIPTQRDSSDCDQYSNGSVNGSPRRSSLSVSDNFPVFASNAKDIVKSDNVFASNSSHGVSLFYVNELARKEIDLAESRLQAREHECALRELQWKYNVDKYKLQSRINDLERIHSQFTLRQPINQLTITYIRNVLLKLLNSKDKQQRQCMINALLTALDAKDSKTKS